MKTAVLLMAHGSRNEEANADTHYFAQELARTGGYFYVQASFLELAEPEIQAGGELCVQQGAQRVVLLPYFLSAGVHFRRDLEEHRRRLAERYPDVDFRLAAPLGRHPLMLDILRDRARETW